MKDLSLHLLDLMDNSMTAGATRIVVSIRADPARGLLEMVVEDNGRGMDAATCAQASDPFFTTHPGKRTGMGLPLVAQAAREAGGSMSVDSAPGRGTRVFATFRLDHPDRKPLGDVDGTIDAVRASHPEIAVSYHRDDVSAFQGGRT
jgi:signal transduction histidine kinase